jgi:hypothetical protein
MRLAICLLALLLACDAGDDTKRVRGPEGGTGGEGDGGQGGTAGMGGSGGGPCAETPPCLFSYLDGAGECQVGTVPAGEPCSWVGCDDGVCSGNGHCDCPP